MNQSDQLNELAAALCSFQGKAESVSKDAKNPFFKSTYASLPNVVQAASPILNECGLSVAQLLGHDEAGDTLTTILLHTSGQWIADTMHLRPVKDDPQAQGSATTYGRRYSYMAILGLVADEDDDGNAASAGSKAAPKPRTRASQPVPAQPPIIDSERLADLKTKVTAAGGAKVKDALTELSITPRSTMAATLAMLTTEQADKFEALLIGAPILPANPEPLNG